MRIHTSRIMRTGVTPIILLSLLIGLLGIPQPVHAADPIVQTFFVPMPEANIQASLRRLYASTGNQINTVISLVGTGDGMVINYDHWEDGYEANIETPVQSTTQIWGDGLASTGCPPKFTCTDANDVINEGTVITLESLVSNGKSVDLPRNPNVIRWDGGDKFAGTKAIVATRASWAENPGTVLAGAVEISDTSKFNRNFLIPFGEDQSYNEVFEYVGIFVSAMTDGTSISIDINADGATDATTTLNQGQTYHVNGGIRTGASVSASQPVQVHVITGDIGTTYESRWFTMYPWEQWSSSYYNPTSTTVADDPAHTFIFNPSGSAITIYYETQAGSGNFSVPAGGSYRYRMPTNSAAHFYTAGGEKFFAVGTMDSDESGTANNVHDWGFTLVPEDNLTPSVVVGWGPSNGAVPPSSAKKGSPVWVTAVNATTIYVKYDGDLGSGGSGTINGYHYDVSYNLSAFESRRISDPDGDQTGMRVFTQDGTYLTAAWGQDPAVADPGNPYLDMGTTVLPLPIYSLHKEASLVNDVDSDGKFDPGDTMQYTVVVQNDGVVILGNVVLEDTLPTETTYVLNSTTINSVPYTDNLAPATPFVLDEGGLNIGDVAVGNRAEVAFQVTINPTSATSITNTATALTDQGRLEVSVDTEIDQPTLTACTLNFTDSSYIPATVYVENDTAYIELDDGNRNTNPGSAQTLTVILTNDATGDRETVTLTENGNNSQLFRGSIPTSTSSGGTVEDGTLYAQAGHTLEVGYTDTMDASDTCTDSIVLARPSKIKILYLDETLELDRVNPAGITPPDTTTSTVTLNTGSAATIAVASTSSGSTSNGTSLTFSHTPGNGSNRLLIVAIGLGGTTNNSNPGTVSGVTYGGTAMTLVGTVQPPAPNQQTRSYIYRLVNPAPGPANVVISTTASSIAAGATTFTGVNQTTPLGTYSSNSATGGTSGSINNLSSATGEVVFSIGSWDVGAAGQTISTAAGQTQVWNISPHNYVGAAASTKPGASLVTVSYTASDNQEWTVGAVPIKPATLAGNPTATFTQSTPMVSSMDMPAGGTVTVTSHINVTSGSLGANPNIVATLKHNGTTFAALSNPTYNAGAGMLTWTGSLGADTNIAAGETVSLDVTTNVAGVTFDLRYDSDTYPSRIELPTDTVIKVDELAIYDDAYPAGTVTASANNGQTVYVRAKVSDPFGSADITGLDVVIHPPNGVGEACEGEPDIVTSLDDTYMVASDAGTKTYEYAWLTGICQGEHVVTVTAKEGYETVTASQQVNISVSFQDTGTPCVADFVDMVNNPVVSYVTSDQVCLQVVDIDKNTSSSTLQSVTATVTRNGSPYEVPTLNETGADTGIFDVYCYPAGTFTNGDVLQLTYNDANDVTDTCSDSTPVASSVNTIGDFVWNDADHDGVQDFAEPGLQGVVVRVYADANSDGIRDSATVVASDTTDSNGAYSMIVPDGSYVLEFDPSGLAGTYTFSAQAQGGDVTKDSNVDPATGHTGTVSVTGGATNNDVDVGLSQAASIGDAVWYDLDHDGLQDGNEPGLQGVVVRAYIDANGDGIRDNTTVVASDTTDSSGAYALTVPAGQYVLEFDMSGLGTYTFSAKAQGSDTTIDSNVNPGTGYTDMITVVGGESRIDVDAGVYTMEGMISGHLYIDSNGNGAQDGGEPDLANVDVLVTNVFGGLQIVSTNASGNWSATVPPGDTDVDVDENDPQFPTGYLQTQGTDPQLNIPVGAGASVDAGIDGYAPGSISGQVRNDADRDGTAGGIADADDSGLAGATVTLYTDPNGNGDPADGAQVGSPIVTPASGNYSFTNLPAGNYVVVETDLANYTSVMDISGANDNRIAVVLAAGANNVGNDFLDLADLGAISGSVLADTDNNGTGDSPLVGVALELLDSVGNQIDSDPGAPGMQPTTTNTLADGSYSFTNVPPGDYQVRETQPNGYYSLSDRDGGNLDLIGDQTLITVNAGAGNAGNDFVERAIVAPSIAKSFLTNPIVAGGTSTLRFTITNSNGTGLVGVAFSDTLPTGVTISSDVTAAQCNGTVAGTAGGNLITFLGGSIPANSSCTVDVTVTAAAGGTYDNISGQVSSTNGGTGNTASDTLRVFDSQPGKQIVATSEASTGFIAPREKVTIGEMVRYRLSAQLPEGSLTNLQFTDNLPTGLQFLDDGTARFAFVSDETGITSSTLTCTNDAGVAADTASLPSADVDCPLTGAISDSGDAGAGFSTGEDVTFSLGNISNADNDSDNEYVVIEFNALVLNVNSGTTINQGIDNDPGSPTAGQSDANWRVNSARMLVNGAQVGADSGNVSVEVAEPAILALAKSETSGGSYLPGTAVEYTLIFTNDATGDNAATAFDIRLTDTLDGNLTPGTVNISSTQGASGVDSCAGGALFTASSSVVLQNVTVDVLCLDVGESVTVEINATIKPAIAEGTTISNDSNLTYTSLPGVQGNCAATPFSCTVFTTGTPGPEISERSGSGGTGSDDLILNNYAAQSGTVTVTVSASPIDAVDDSAGPVNGLTGATNVLNVFGNDTLNGVAVNPADVTLTRQAGGDPELVLNPDGSVDVPLGTSAGSYSFDYQICENLNPTNCDIATVTVTVVTIDAVNDSGATVNGAVGGTSIADILVNDSLNGVAATVANVTITAVGVWPAGVTLDTGTGAVMVAAGTAAGTYTPQYQICSQANPSFCDTATVTVPVVVIEAVNDTGATIDGAVGGTSISNVLVNDTLNGASATTSNVTITAVGVWPAGVALDTGTGEVTVAAGTAAGTYTPQYQICSQTDPSVCDTATVTVPVVVIDAVNDSGMAINGSVGGTSIADVLVNDTLNGAAATTGNVTITAVGIWPSGVTLNTSTGAVTVASGTAAGTYTPQYQICSQANPSVCDTATVTVPVSAAPIDAVDDSAGPVNGLTGATNVLNVFGNDTLNGVAVNPADVTLTRQAGGDPELVLNPDGSVDVPLGTSAGSYSFDYQICENLNPTNCDIATVTVTVVVIDAVNDSGSAVNGAAGGTSLANVLVNDTLNGNPATLATVDMTFVSSTHAGVTLDLADGSVDVAAGTPAGNYTLTYQICDRANPAICDTATVAVPVAANNPPTATDNEAAVDTTTPAHTANMVTDDEGNGVDSDPDGDSLTVTQVDGETNPAIVLVGTYGTLDWATDGSYTYTIDTSDTDFLLLAGGATGTETFLYTISDGYGGTATADIIITVTGADDVPVANDDSFTIVEDTTLNGDLRPDHGSGADAPSGDGGNVWSEVTGAGPSHGTVTVNPNGTFTYNPDANYNGPDSFTYQICDVDNDCDQAVVNLTVTSVDDPSIGIAKRVANVTRSGSGSFDVTMEFHVQNYGDVTLNNVQVTDDLSVTFPAPSTFTVQSVTISNQTNAVLTANPGYNGSTDTALLTPLGNSLAINGSGTITVLVHVLPSISGPFYNSAVTTGEPPSGTLVTDDSADGTDPDNTNNCPSCINGDGDPTNNTKLTEVNFDPNIFDPPFGFKELDASGLPVLRWTLIWINDNNFPSVAAVSDPIPARTTYEATGASSGYAVPGGAPSGSTNVGVSCTTDSAAEPAPGDAESSTSLCYYEGPTGTYPRGRIVWEGALGPDLGATNQANANDEVYISFTVRVGTGVTTVQNVATIDADLNNDGDRTDSGEQVVATAQAAWQEPITPVDGREGKKLPATGFAPNKVTTLPDQKPEQAYLNLGDLWLEIPSLGIKTSIVGVPKVDGVWNVDWLWEQTGWLQGTAFPTWKGNSLLTAHVYLPDGKPGPFLDLGKLRYGDQVIVHAFGQRHVFEIRANNIILPIDMSPFKHEEKAWLTLLTCKGYEESSDTYKYRVAVRAVLVKIEPE